MLRGRGYTVVRAAQSRGPADLLAGRPAPGGYRESKVLAVQAKGGRSPFGQAARAELSAVARAFLATPVLYGRGGLWYEVYQDGGKYGLRELDPDLL